MWQLAGAQFFTMAHLPQRWLCSADSMVDFNHPKMVWIEHLANVSIG
jgi:hypothetical protein